MNDNMCIFLRNFSRLILFESRDLSQRMTIQFLNGNTVDYIEITCTHKVLENIVSLQARVLQTAKPKFTYLTISIIS